MSKTLELEIDGTTNNYNLPTEWDDITVRQLQKVAKIQAEDNPNLIETSAKVIAALLDIELETVYMLSPQAFNQLTAEVEFLNTDITTTSVDSIMVGDDEYFLKKDYNKLTMGEVISIQAIINKSKDNIIEAMPELLCIFLRKKNNGELETFKNSFMDRAEIFMDIPITQVYSILINFSNGGD